VTFPLTLTRPLTFFDLETTGLDTRTARIVEIAIWRLNPDGSVTEWWSLINPGINIPSEATAKHGITNEHVAEKPRFEELAHRVLPAFQDVDYGGYNLKYDLAVLKSEFARCQVMAEQKPGVAPPRILDGFRLWQITHPRTLSDYIEAMTGKTHDDAHSAKGDVLGTMQAMKEHLLAYPEVLPLDLDQLHALQFPVIPNAIDALGKLKWNDQGEATVTFGKHAGWTLSTVPASYLRYLLSTECPDDFAAILKRALQGSYPTK
jgi:DNA polymerase-3 subunit epsilon